MSRRIAYWGTTVIVAIMLLGSLSYLTGNEQVVSGFAKPAIRNIFESFSESPANRRDRAGAAGPRVAQGMGVCGRHVRLDHGVHLGNGLE